MHAFQELDYLDFSDCYTEDERMVRDTVRNFVSERFLPLVQEHWEAGTFPTELTPELAQLGVFGSNLPEKYGCAGLNNKAYGLICQELERGDSGLRSFVSVQGALVMYPIYAFGSEEQRQRWLPKLAAGEAIGCFGLTEPDFGSNPGGMLSTCRKKGGDWILNGRKMWITNGTLAHVAVFWAKDEQGRVRGFLIERGAKGYTAPEQKHKWSLRCSVTSELVCDDVRVPAESELPNTDGLKSALMCLTQARYGIAWGGVGAALACFDEALRYAKERIVFGRPLASFQIPQKKFADVATDITLAQMMSLRLAQMKDEGRLKHHHVSMGKRNNVAMALNAARVLRDVLGANGITLEYGIGRHMCNLETVYTYEGTHDIHTLSIAEHLTGFPAYR
jgi:glutaryl-CoA dehydrogenase